MFRIEPNMQLYKSFGLTTPRLAQIFLYQIEKETGGLSFILENFHFHFKPNAKKIYISIYINELVQVALSLYILTFQKN